jgi:hypothetical protein
MKAILEFSLPEDQHDHKYALAGTDALICISDLLNEIRAKLKHDGGEFKDCDEETLEKVRDYVVQLKIDRELPELI